MDRKHLAGWPNGKASLSGGEDCRLVIVHPKYAFLNVGSFEYCVGRFFSFDTLSRNIYDKIYLLLTVVIYYIMQCLSRVNY
jgi:hypothetical protein